jgi:hypothetical protein
MQVRQIDATLLQRIAKSRQRVAQKFSGNRVAGINLCIEAAVAHFHHNIYRTKLPRVNVESQPIVPCRDIGRQTLTQRLGKLPSSELTGREVLGWRELI